MGNDAIARRAAGRSVAAAHQPDREVGLGLEVGDYGGREGAFVTEDFARSGSGVFLTGVAFDDQDGDRFYDVGEGLGGLTLTAVSSTGATYTTTTYGSGGCDLVLPPAIYTRSRSPGLAFKPPPCRPRSAAAMSSST